jgi:hypothetical protein
MGRPTSRASERQSVPQLGLFQDQYNSVAGGGLPEEAGQRDPRWVLHGLITGHYVSRALYVAAKLGIADLLKDGPKSTVDLAAATQSHPATLHRLMLLLTSAGVFAETGPACFCLTPMGEFLRSDVAGSQHAQAILFAGPHQQRAWSRLLEMIQSGQAASSTAFFPFLAKHPEEAAIFYDAMAARTESIVSAFLAAYDCSRFSTIVELGGGYGSLLRNILKANHGQRGILFDLPAVAEKAIEYVRSDELASRCEVMAGDFFGVLPRGADAYILKNVIHDWNDAQATAVLGNVAQAMAPGGKVLLIEMVIPQPGGEWSQIIAGSDLNMLVNTGGQERSAAEFRRLFEGAGLELKQIVLTRTPWSVLEGVRRASSAGEGAI